MEAIISKALPAVYLEYTAGSSAKYIQRQEPVMYIQHTLLGSVQYTTLAQKGEDLWCRSTSAQIWPHNGMWPIPSRKKCQAKPNILISRLVSLIYCVHIPSIDHLSSDTIVG